MSVVCAIGAQWGDEGKGKVVDLLTERADVVVRFGGGANAGHTLVLGDDTLITHLIPSGVLHPGTACVLGDGMVIDPETLVDEIAAIQARGLLSGGELLVSDRAHVVMPYHKLIEARREAGRGAIGTTGRGIGPAYEAKAARRGIRVRDLLRPDRLRELVARNLDEISPLIATLGGREPSAADIAGWIDAAARAGEALAPHIGDASRFIHGAIGDHKRVLCEGAQGALLDIDHGTYPYVTSSATGAAGACQGAGIGPTDIDRVVGITKAYATRVGSGPFPTEMAAEMAAVWREAGAERGATTGRPRRVGWLDIPALRLAIRKNGITALALTKLDVAVGQPEIQVCVAYDLDGRQIDEMPLDPDDLARATPRYQRFAGWDAPCREARAVDDLPGAAQTYVSALESLLGVPFFLISVGPARAATISLSDPFAE
ncbi:MAG TPA: adenylosuccinate synthase [Kofleriaceae bacterium]|nr:adenylosuccinate synthase [Kofleriaceae bacterium]